VGATDVRPTSPIAGAARYAALWDNGSLVHAATTTTYGFNDINKAGIAGWSTQSGRRVATRFDRAGKADPLPNDPQWTSSTAVAVNDRGDIAGWATVQPSRHVALVWPANAPGTFRVLPTAKPLTSPPQVTDIDELGRVTAGLDFWDTNEHPAVVWDVNQILRTLQPTASGNPARNPTAVRAGRILAESVEGAGEWNLSGSHVRTFDSGRAAYAYAIGGGGTVGGQRAPQQFAAYQAVLWRDGKLATALPSDPLYEASVRHISDDEQTAYGTESVLHVMPPSFYSKNPVQWRCS
jgi:hypothetical protein